jgi:hypothetical protein
VRGELIKTGAVIERPTPKTGEASPDLTDWQRKIADLVNRLTDGVPVDVLDRSAEQHARWLLAHILDWHRREEKAVWWEYFRLSALTAEDLTDERAALSGFAFLEPVGGTAKAPIHRYSFPVQDTDVRGEEDLRSLGGAKFGKVDAILLDSRTIDIKKRKDTADLHPKAVFAHQIIDTKFSLRRWFASVSTSLTMEWRVMARTGPRATC